MQAGTAASLPVGHDQILLTLMTSTVMSAFSDKKEEFSAYF